MKSNKRRLHHPLVAAAEPLAAQSVRSGTSRPLPPPTDQAAKLVESQRQLGARATLVELLKEAERKLIEVRRNRRCIWSRESPGYWQLRGQEGALVFVVRTLHRKIGEVSRGGNSVLSNVGEQKEPDAR